MTSLRHIGRSERPARDLYLDAARECLLDVGWRRTTLTEVARRSGVSRMTIYRAWPDMPTLLGDLMTREWGELVAATLAAEPTDDDPARALAHALVAVTRALRDNEVFVRLLELDPDLLLPYLLARRGRSQQAIIDLLAAQVTAGQATGGIRAGDPTAIARSVVLAAHGFVLSAQTMVGDGVEPDDLDAELALLVERGLRP